MTQPVIPIKLFQILTIRVHAVNNNTIIACYAVGQNGKFKTGSKVYQNVSNKAMKRCKLEILNQGLIALGEGKRVCIAVEENFIHDFINENKLINETYYQDIVEELRFHLSLCSSVICKSFVPREAFDAALKQYKHAKFDLLPDSDPYKQIKMVTDRRIREAKQYEAAISNW